VFDEVSARTTIDFEVSRHLHEVDGDLEFKLFAVAADVDVRSRVRVEEEKPADHERKGEKAGRMIIVDMSSSKKMRGRRPSPIENG
jgi:hypothetical protein